MRGAAGVPGAVFTEPYVYVIRADTGSGFDRSAAERGNALVEALAGRVPLMSEDLYDPDVALTDDGEAAKLRNAAAVLAVWSARSDPGLLTTYTDRSPGTVFVAALDQRQPRLSTHRITELIDFDDWDGDRTDRRVLLLEQLLLEKLSLTASASSVTGPEDELPDFGHDLSASARAVLERCFMRQRGPGLLPEATDLLLEALFHQAVGGVGAMLVRVLAGQQEVPESELLEGVSRFRPVAAAASTGIALGPPLDGLLAFARRCAERVSGRSRIHLRHLVAAAVLSDNPPVDSAVTARLGTTAAELPRQLLAALRLTTHGDSLDAWEQLLAVSLAGGFDADLVDPNQAIARDRDNLGHGVWAAMFASVIADASTPTPVSVGLFGEWGSGKSTFMGLLRGEIADLQGRPGYLRDVVQIGFNAWHYADANLWASLGDEIFRALADELTPAGEPEPSGQAASLLRQITEKRGMADDARARQRQAEQAAQTQGERLASQARIARGNRQLKARELAAALLRSPQVDDAVKKEADKAWQRLGISDQVDQGEILAGQLDGISQDTRALRSLLGWRMTWALTALCVAALLLTIAAHAFAGDWASWLGGLGNWLRHYGALGALAAALASAAALAGRVRSGLAALKSAAQQAADQAKRSASKEIEEARDSLRAAQARERAADAELDRINLHLADLERQLAALAPGRRMYAFLAERAASGDYAGQLSLVSVIRKDLKHLVDVLREHHRQLDRTEAGTDGTAGTAGADGSIGGAGTAGAAGSIGGAGTVRDAGRAGAAGIERGGPVRRIDRIVLYIDDLDRCPPSQVVDVLQAVHLLLALDLFVVVVGVDPRWLVRSLRERYPHTLPEVAADGGRSLADRGAVGEAVPTDYLQKIFNLPFALPAFRGDQLEQLVRRLASGPAANVAGPRKSQSRGTVQPDGGAAQDSLAAADHAARPGTDDAAPAVTAGAAIAAEPGSQVAAVQAAADPAGAGLAGDVLIRAQQLSEEELRFLGGLGPFIKTPRDAKRLFNVYRMLRSTRDLSPASAFLGGEYQAVALLLAMLTLDAHLLARALDALPDLPSGVAGGLSHWAADRTWRDFTEELAPRQTTDATWRNGIVGPVSSAEAGAWRRMAGAAESASTLVTLADLTAFQGWAPHVRRFSYRPLGTEL